VPDDPPLWRDPARLLFLIGAICLIAGSLVPWAEGLDPVGRPAAYRPTEGTAQRQLAGSSAGLSVVTRAAASRQISGSKPLRASSAYAF
jgi:hypothetical protein